MPPNGFPVVRQHIRRNPRGSGCTAALRTELGQT